MSSMPRDALNTRASKPGVIGVPSSRLSALARAISSGGSEMSAGVILFITSAAVKPSIRSAPTLKIWMTPFASVAMLEKLALLKIALCRAPRLEQRLFRLVGNCIFSALGDAKSRHLLVVSNSQYTSPGNSCSPRLADRLRGFKTTLQEVLQLSFGAEFACTAFEGSARLQQTSSSFYR